MSKFVPGVIQMDSKAQRKALFRSKLRETSQKHEKRIDSPLVRYNEDDQPVCRVCNVTLKSESLWPAHQASKKHHEAIENIKAAAAAARQSTPVNLERQQKLPESRVASSTLPADFFDGQDAKKQKTEDVENASGSGASYSSLSKEMEQSKTAGSTAPSSKQMGSNDVTMQVKTVLPKGFSDLGTDEEPNSSQKSKASRDNKNLESEEAKGFLPSGFFDRTDSNGEDQAKQLSQDSEKQDIVQLKQVKGALPEGFFDNKDKDLRARGIEPVKVDIDDAYKEFEREIQEDLQEVDDRLEEEEIDAAEVREEIESLEHKAYRERVELVKKKLIEAKESRLARLRKSPEFKVKDSSDDSSSSDEDDDDEDFSVDWRAKRF